MDGLLTAQRFAKSSALAALLALFLSAAANAQDVSAGLAVFRTNCAVCHMAAANGHALIGPNLWGVVGRRAASMQGFNYSPPMQHSGITWTADQLQAFVQAPSHVVPGTRMTFAGLRSPQQASALVAYLATLH
jgi:cytochrome c